MATTNANLVIGNLTEGVTFDGIQAANGVIPGVKLIGLTSRNKRRYTEGALIKAHRDKVYEGATVYVDHPQSRNGATPRSYRDRFARVENVRFRKGDGLYGDLKFNPKHPIAEQVVWDAANKTAGVGLSHNIQAGYRTAGGEEIIEEITRVNSVDLVDNPATTKSFYECEQCTREDCPAKKEGKKEQTVAQVLRASYGNKPATTKTLLEAIAADPVMGAAGMAPMNAASGNPDDAIKAGIRTAVMAAFDDPSLDSQETIDKIKKLLDAQDAALGKAPAAEAGDKVAAQLPPTPPTDSDSPDKEQEAPGHADENEAADDKSQEKKKFEQVERRGLAMEALATARVSPRPELVKELMEQATLESMRSTILSWSPAKRGAAKPRMSTAMMTEQTALDRFPDTHEGFVEALRRRS